MKLFEKQEQPNRTVFKLLADASSVWKRFEFYPAEDRIVIVCTQVMAALIQKQARKRGIIGATEKLDTQELQDYENEPGKGFVKRINTRVNIQESGKFADVILAVASQNLDPELVAYIRNLYKKDFSAIINQHARDGFAPIHRAIHMMDINHDTDDINNFYHLGLQACINKGADVNLTTKTFKPYTALDLHLLGLSAGSGMLLSESDKDHPFKVTSLLLYKGAEPQSPQLVDVLRALGTYGTDFFPITQRIANGEDTGTSPLWDQEYLDLMYTCVAFCLHYGANFELIMQGLQTRIRKESAYTDEFAAEKTAEIRAIVEPEILRCYNQAVIDGLLDGVVKQDILEIGTGEDFMGFVPVTFSGRPRNNSR